LKEREPDSKVIIFSQWDSMLHMIGDTLYENNIPHVYVKGNVHQRNKAIETFQNDEKVSVIMLSLQNAASGINLTQANYVILIDPVAGTKEEARAIETQAIGRAYRQVMNY
jgi:SNF2 family DNA or RNA helicase